MRNALTIVTGAPASGKSTTVAELLLIQSDFIVLDIDWLADSAGRLAGKSIYSDSSTWQPYGAVWFEFLHAIYKNSKHAIFFTPNTPTDIESQGVPDWIDNIDWLLLDCRDDVRTTRLDARSGWGDERKQEALDDAHELRLFNLPNIDTSELQPREVAAKILTLASHI